VPAEHAGQGHHLKSVDDVAHRRRLAVGGYTATAVLSSLTGTFSNVITVGLLHGGAWATRGLRVPVRNALLADVVPASATAAPTDSSAPRPGLGDVPMITPQDRQRE
jgi:hypothetical protein